MPGRYTGQLRSGGGSSGGGGGRYTSQIRAGGGGGGKRGKQKKDEGRHGVGGFFGNLYEDVKSSVTGLPGFAAHAGVASWHDLQQFNRDPFHWHSSQLAHDIVVPAARATAHTWSPLVLHGDIGETGRRIYQDPLSLLDLAAGAGLAAKGLRAGGLIAEAPRVIELRAPSGAVVTRPVVGGEIVRRLKIGADEALKRLPPEFQVTLGGRSRTISVPLSEEHRYARAVRSRGDKYQAGLVLRGRFYGPSLARLSKTEEIASNLRQDYPLRSDLDAEIARLRGGAETGATDIGRRVRIRQLRQDVAAAERRADEAHAAAREAGERLARGEIGTAGHARALDLARTANAALARARDALKQAEQEPIVAAAAVAENPAVRVMTDPKVLEKYENPTAKMHVYESEAKALGEEGANLLGLTETEQRAYLASLLARGAKFRYKPVVGTDADLGRSVRWNGREGKLVKLSDDLEEATLRFPGKGGKGVYTKTVPLSEVTQTTKELVAPGRRTIEAMIEEIRAEAEAAGRPLPQYRPHKSVEEPTRYGGTGGRVPAMNPARHANEGILVDMGRAAYDIDTLGPQWGRTVKYAVYNNRHTQMVNAAVGVEKLPEGWEFVKRNRSERIGYTERTAGEFERRLEEMFPDEAEPTSMEGFREELTSKNPHLDPEDAALDERGLRLAVPKKVANSIAGEYVRESWALRNLWERPTQVWRALVLNLRVGWLVNNIVGNTFLYMIKNAGPAGLAAYLRALQDVKGTVAVRRVLDDTKVRNRLTPDDIAEILPEQVAGTFFGTQAAKQGRVMRAVGKPTRALRAADVAYEQALRRAMINRLVRTNPEFKRFYNRLPKETRNFRAAAKKHLEDNPELVDRISKQVNDSLGDFFSLGRFERTALRGVAPFFAWYRAITLIAVKLPVDHPIRAAILLKLGQVGDEYTEDFGVPYLEGAIPLGGNEILKTRGVNPLVTPFDTGEAVVAGGQAVAGVPGVNQNAAFNFLGMLNPLAIAAIQGVASQSRGEYPARGSGLYGVARGLPETQLFAPFDSKLYEGDARRRALLSYLGVPIVRVNPAEARKR